MSKRKFDNVCKWCGKVMSKLTPSKWWKYFNSFENYQMFKKIGACQGCQSSGKIMGCRKDSNV